MPEVTHFKRKVSEVCKIWQNLLSIKIEGVVTVREQEIVELFWKRQEQAIEEASLQYGAYCRKIAANILVNQEDTRECLNDTWFQAWNTIPPQRPQHLKAFLGKITRNLAINQWKYQRAGKRIQPEAMVAIEELGECVSDIDQPEAALLVEELKQEINQFLRGLSNQDQGMFVQRYFYLEPIWEIARYHGVSENVVSVRLNRIRKQLKRYLTERGYYL